MIPKTELRYAKVYIKKWVSSFSTEDLERLKQDCDKFEKIYYKNIKEILKNIEKYSGHKWKREYVPIYIVKRRPSFSDPLTLNYKKNPKMMLVILIHELLHCNIPGKYEKNDLHIFMEGIMEKIISELKINLNEELKKIHEKIRSKF